MADFGAKGYVYIKEGESLNERKTSKGVAVLGFKMRTRRDGWRGKQKEGEQYPPSDWWNVTVFDEARVAPLRNLKNGDYVYVKGTISQTEFEVEGKKRTGYEVDADWVMVAAPKVDTQAATPAVADDDDGPDPLD